MWQSSSYTFSAGNKHAGSLEVQIMSGIDWPGAPALMERAISTAWPHIAKLAHAPLPFSLSIRLGLPAEGQRLNRDFRGKDYVPDILSFETDDDDAQTDGADDFYLGDIFIVAEKVHEAAALQNKPADEHLTHLVVHGLLHVCGHDHELGEAEAAAMEALEAEILLDMGIENPYQGDPV